MPSDEMHPLRSVGMAPVRWTRSALTTAFLAIAAVAPAASIAAEPDTSQEGGGSSGQVLDQDSDSPTFDPGGETDLPYDTGPGSADGSPDAAPLESEPVDDPEGRTAPFAEPQTPAPSGPEQAPARPIEEPSPVAARTEDRASIERTRYPAALAIPPQHLGAERGSRPALGDETWTVVTSAVPAAGRPRRDERPAPTRDRCTAGAEANSRAGTALATRRSVASVATAARRRPHPRRPPRRVALDHCRESPR